MAVRIRVRGLPELQSKLARPFMVRPARNFLNRGSRVVQQRARDNAPYFNGGLRDSIEIEIDSSALPLWAKIGTNIEYGRATELGRPAGIMPPSAPLELWAVRKGMEPGSGYALALAIFRRGIEARPFLEPALNESRPQIIGLVRVMAAEIEAEMAGGA
jgi:hypothetical protein